MGEFIGEVQPVYGRWTWPLRVMQPGDWFIVSKALRKPEEVRNLMSVRASQMGVRVSVTKHPKEYPGYTKVEMVDLTKSAEKPDGQLVDYATAGQFLELWYRFNIDEIPFWDIYSKGKERVYAPQVIDEVPVKRIIFDAHERGKLVGLVFDAQGFDCYALGKYTTIESWKLESEEPTLEDIMS